MLDFVLAISLGCAYGYANCYTSNKVTTTGIESITQVCANHKDDPLSRLYYKGVRRTIKFYSNGTHYTFLIHRCYTPAA